MEIEAYIKKLKDIYRLLLDFIDIENDSEDTFEKLIKKIEKRQFLQNKIELRLFLQLISRIADNHHRTTNFFNKLDKIIQYSIKDKFIPIFAHLNQYCNLNKRILFFLLEKKYIIPDEDYISFYMKSVQFTDHSYYDYLYPVMKNYVGKANAPNYKVSEEKCHIGENDSYFTSLIRDDLIEDFIYYINRTNIPLWSQIKPSIYETNSLLIEKQFEVTLIEYAVFFGSIQIFSYLRNNKIKAKSSLWPYAIHSNNAEIINILEETEINDKNFSVDDLLVESIKCHHNEIADYIYYNMNCSFEGENGFSEKYKSVIFDSYNFYYFPSNIKYIISSQEQLSIKIENIIFSLKEITIPSSVTTIGRKSFCGCFLITKIIIPSSVTDIKDGAFKGCASLVQIAIPSSVTSIGNYVFSKCSSLKQVTIPSSIISIGEYAFSGCSSLTQITIPSVGPICKYAFNRCSSLTQIIIGSVFWICKYAFNDCSSLKQITIPSSMNSIGEYAFYNCTGLEQITIPSSVISIKCSAFEGCSSLKQITFPSSVNYIGNCAFKKCSSLTQITIPYSVTYIGDYAFNECSSLTQIKIPSSLASSIFTAFEGRSSSAKITFL